ncbi:6795_t:CDS:2, partial [Funneliformis geosporum]
TPDAKNWKVKYYKRHKKPFAPMKEGERELIDMVFNKKKADDRKTWINYFEVCLEFFFCYLIPECKPFNDNSHSKFLSFSSPVPMMSKKKRTLSAES